MTITIIRQAPSIGETRIRYTQQNISLHVTPPSTLIQNPGTLYIADECLSFFSTESNTGFSIPYPSIIIHAIARESHVGPSIYCQLEGSLASSGPSLNGNGHTNNNSTTGDGEEEDDEEDPVLELSFAPADVSTLDTIYESLSYCASLHQDEDAEDYNMDEDEMYDDENDHDGLYADADIQGGYVPKPNGPTVTEVTPSSTSAAAIASEPTDDQIVESIPAVDLQNGEWYTGNPEVDAKFELSEQGQVIVNQWRQNEKEHQQQENVSGKTAVAIPGKRVREEAEGGNDQDMDPVGEGENEDAKEYTEEESQEARSKMWRIH
ncbi:hypothetical protein BX616_009296 [Lobosporangium transversale]|uniref:Regulator of volume decrease after cellular swelling-domain-containing protein n=1 Tax=Lobosporangium transversale TaxID=64571 RepID=A0A1Y2GWL0_9FUNG|nr:regulator of volume decrease after cellular swelling-domain-containing protein [Lobosporangium transversale]KAF9913929.1 hypothetical protein BX616_009296 [Lobosporangium transversale]ORZ23814.1 regulator of volume decrease after cellular swelling-domain-containing protein [Lobosporangium transversale]|eukprot:XP_021883628.1 regulator of volume decrease after cellular swelling-domain-containing protein [Lobosporangium transversale]